MSFGRLCLPQSLSPSLELLDSPSPYYIRGILRDAASLAPGERKGRLPFPDESAGSVISSSDLCKNLTFGFIGFSLLFPVLLVSAVTFVISSLPLWTPLALAVCLFACLVSSQLSTPCSEASSQVLAQAHGPASLLPRSPQRHSIVPAPRR